MLDFLNPLYWAGLFACGAQGYNNTRGNWSTSIILFAAFGGGIVRDGAILHRPLAVLSLDAIPEICIAWLGAMSQALCVGKSVFTIFLSLLDSAAVSTFFIIGADAAQCCGCGPIVVWASGVVTALGGGMLSAWLSGSRLQDIVSSNIPYRCIVIVATALYVFWTYTGVSPLEAQCTVVLLTCVSNLMLSEWFKKLLKCLMQKQVLLAAPFKYTMILIILPPYLWQKGEYIYYRASRAYAFSLHPWLRPLYHLMQPT